MYAIMKINRRSVLAGAAGSATIGVLGTGVAAADETKGDTLPDPNVPDAGVYAFPNEEDPITVEAGEWITFSNAWITSNAEGFDECTLSNLLNNSVNTFIIGDEKFVLDSLDDWDFDPDADGEDNEGREVFCRARFTHSIPPKPPGTTFTFRWEFEITDEEAVEGEFDFPFENEVEVVRRNGNR